MADTALVTGGKRGIGRAIASALAGEGFNVAVMDIQSEDEGVAGELQTEGAPKALYCSGNVADAQDRQKVLEQVRDNLGGINVLVNNAGISPRERADILEASEASFEEVMKINLQGPYFLTQAVANTMVQNRQNDPDFNATIINISSISATVASVNRGEYCLSKAGVSMATMLWATRLAEHEIPVYEIRPGLIQTEMTSGVREKYTRLISEGLTLQKRWGYPEDIGRAVVPLVRGDLAYSTGQVIRVDGGLTQQVL